MGRQVYRVRDAQAIEGSSADERMERPGRDRREGGPVPQTKIGQQRRSVLKSGPAWLEGVRNGTQVQNNPSGKNDQKDVNRGRPITY
jgi:hypothetical protein